MKTSMNAGNGRTVEARGYTLTFLSDRPYVRVERRGRTLCTLFLPSGCRAVEGRDVTSILGPWTVEETGKETVLRAEADSSFWNRKTYAFSCREDGFEYGMTVEGRGTLDAVEYFSGWYTGSLRWSAGRFYSGFEIDTLFNPEPDGSERSRSSPRERSAIDLTGVPIHGRDHWFFTPPPFCFVAERPDFSFSIGVKAAPGCHRYTEFSWEGGRGQFLRLSYEGMTKVDGTYVLPGLVFLFDESGGSGDDAAYGLLSRYCDELRDPSPRERPKAPWWGRPIVCGWGAQCSEAGLAKLPAPALAREDFYRRIVSRLEELSLPAGTLVIDDKWQLQYGLNQVDEEKWPDMKGFIAGLHRKGLKVLLWLKAWDPEGLETDLCIRDFAGNRLAADPTNPRYAGMFRERVRSLLSPDGLDADGFKLDFSARIPSAPGCRLHDDVWGLELMRRYLLLLHSAAKEAKADALVMTHTPNPYLEDLVDMIRLNDVNTGADDIVGAMVRRARTARAACPSCLIDTDNWPMPDRRTWLEYLRRQPGLGVPSLYYLWRIDGSGEPVTTEDAAEIRELWNRYEADRKEENNG